MRAKRPANKCYKAGASSASFYRKFLEAFEGTEGGIESLEEDDLLYYIKARFELGRILHKVHGVWPKGLEGNRNACMSESLMHLQWIEDFTEKHRKWTRRFLPPLPPSHPPPACPPLSLSRPSFALWIPLLST